MAFHPTMMRSFSGGRAATWVRVMHWPPHARLPTWPNTCRTAAKPAIELGTGRSTVTTCGGRIAASNALARCGSFPSWCLPHASPTSPCGHSMRMRATEPTSRTPRYARIAGVSAFNAPLLITAGKKRRREHPFGCVATGRACPWRARFHHRADLSKVAAACAAVVIHRHGLMSSSVDAASPPDSTPPGSGGATAWGVRKSTLNPSGMALFQEAVEKHVSRDPAGQHSLGNGDCPDKFGDGFLPNEKHEVQEPQHPPCSPT